MFRVFFGGIMLLVAFCFGAYGPPEDVRDRHIEAVERIQEERDRNEFRPAPEQQKSSSTNAGNTVYFTGLYGGNHDDDDDSSSLRTTKAQASQPIKSEKQIREDITRRVQTEERLAFQRGYSSPMFTDSMREQMVAQELRAQAQAEQRNPKPVVATVPFTQPPYQAPQPQYQAQPASSQTKPLYRTSNYWTQGFPTN